MKRFAILCCALLAASGARAQITLDDCRRLAREHYPEIRQYDLIRRLYPVERPPGLAAAGLAFGAGYLADRRARIPRTDDRIVCRTGN